MLSEHKSNTAILSADVCYGKTIVSLTNDYNRTKIYVQSEFRLGYCEVYITSSDLNKMATNKLWPFMLRV